MAIPVVVPALNSSPMVVASVTVRLPGFGQPELVVRFWVTRESAQVVGFAL